MAYTVALAVLVFAAKMYGLVVGDSYRLVSDMTRASWLAQDAVTLAALPLLVLAAWRARAGSLNAQMAWVGLLTWITYGYAQVSARTPRLSDFARTLASHAV